MKTSSKMLARRDRATLAYPELALTSRAPVAVRSCPRLSAEVHNVSLTYAAGPSELVRTRLGQALIRCWGCRVGFGGGLLIRAAVAICARLRRSTAGPWAMPAQR